MTQTGKTIKKIVKRDGKIEKFTAKKITEVLAKAGKHTGEFDEKKAKQLTVKVLQLAYQTKDENLPSAEFIGDIVEMVLMDNYKETAKCFILYRDQNKRLTEITTKEQIKLMDLYLKQKDWQVAENSNMGYSLSGLNNYISSEISKKYWLNKIYPADIREAHISGDFHIHDLSNVANYCEGWSLYDLLVDGFQGMKGKIESAPAKHFRAALGQMVNFIFTLQNESAGAQAFSNVDTLLAPFIRYDELSYKEVKQGLQEFFFNMNVTTRQGNQSPFSNVTLDLKVSSNYAEQPVVIGGELQRDKYKEFQKEMDIFNKAFFEVLMEGDSRGQIFTFPIPTINITKDFDWDNPALDNMWEATAKYGPCYFSNYVNSSMDPSQITSMCPLSSNEKILYKSLRYKRMEFSTIGSLTSDGKQEYEIYSEGEFKPAILRKYNNLEMYKIVLANNHELEVSKEHLNFTKEHINSREKTIPTNQLKVGDYLPYSLNKYKGEGSNYDFGYFVGAFAGDGSIEDTKVIFSLSKGKKEITLKKLEKIVLKYFGNEYKIKKHSDSASISFHVYSKAAVGLCREFVTGKKINKNYSPSIFSKSIEFRRGIFDGHYETDGGNRNRIYTSSKEMVKSLNMLAATLGTVTSIVKDDRPLDPNLKGIDVSKTPNTRYAVSFYKLNRDKYGDVWFKESNKLWMKIKDIKKKPKKQVGFCFEVLEDKKPIFTVGTTGILTHNCRLRIDHNDLEMRGGGLFGSNPLTGSIGVVTLNMARIGFNAKDEKEYFSALEHLMLLARESLEIKRATIEAFMDSNLYPYSKFYLRNTKERLGSYWKNHFSTIGLVGMSESCLNFLGDDISTKKGKAFAEKVLDFMRKKLIEFQKETKNNYNLEASPSESTALRLALKDKELNKDIICANEENYRKGAEPYYSNSSQLPVDFTDDLFEALDNQDSLQCKYTGGTVFHVFLGERIEDPELGKKLIKKILTNYKMPYISITPTFSICPICGYLPGEHHYCPQCDERLLREQQERNANL